MSQQAIRFERRRLVGRRVLHFLRHLGEMTVAMMVGMFSLGWATQGTFDFGSVGPLRSAELSALVMAFSMTIPMAAWMRYRRHGWAPTLEMSAAMIVPAVALVVAFRLGAISGASVLSLQHSLMLPSMLAAMLYRRSEYIG